MSCVSPKEIVGIVAKVFGVTPEAMRQRSSRSVSWPFTARGVAVVLIRRHTTADVTQLCRALGVSHVGQMRTSTVKLGKATELQAERYSALAGLIAKCEAKIDRLHDKRVEKIEREAAAIAATRRSVVVKKLAHVPQSRRGYSGKCGALWACP